MWDCWNDCRRWNKKRKGWGFCPSAGICVCVCVCEYACKCCLLDVARSAHSPAFSPPDVGGLGVFLLSDHPGLWPLATCSLAVAAGLSAESRLTVLLLVSLPWQTRVLLLGLGRHVAVVVLHCGPRGRRGEGGAKTEAVTQGPPVLLAL